ncbi:hypothetical protein GLOIN_2v1610121 [Rhizophagus clarus]|uniref:Uncharacterized protein n=1 Tax=Rhizophagus clarus TaxID=94130 RepID=A0A8H3MDY9_9GLOM|nr:hypothetical protein GLOIN_2v1610121 [Rhizophagus clarus]
MKYIFRAFAGKRLGDCKAYIYFCSEISRNLLSERHKFLNINVGTNEIGLELMLGYDTEIAELRKENVEIPELREKLLKFAEVEAENAKLRQVIEENPKRDAENAELKTEVARLRHDIEEMNIKY